MIYGCIGLIGISKLLAETSAEVLKKLDEKDKTINGVMDQLKAISISIPAEMLSQQTQILEIKTLVVNLGERTVKELQSISRGVDNVQERLQGQLFDIHSQY